MTADDLKLIAFVKERRGGYMAAMMLLLLDRGGAGSGAIREMIRQAMTDPTYNLPGEGEFQL